MRAAEKAFAAALAYSALSGLLLLVQVVLAGLLILAVNFAARPFCSEGACPGPLALDSAAFAFISAVTALSQYYLASLFQHSHRSRVLTLSTVLTALFVTMFVFAPLAARSRFEAYWLAWLPLAASFLLGALPAVFQKEPDNPWRDSPPDLFRF
jgi:predicted neutral ceramidase superfamily lipid hydrolase